MKKKMKRIFKMKKIKQKRKEKQGKGQRRKNLEELNNNCTSLWAKLTNVGLGVASVLQKQVTHKIELDINVISLAGKFHNEQ